jgi:hypothetical protein
MVSRIVFLLVFTAGGYLLGIREGEPYLGALWGAGAGILGVVLEFLFSKTGAGTILSGIIGLSIGLVFAKLIYYPIKTLFVNIDEVYTPVVLNAVFGYSGLLLGLRKGKSFSLSKIVKSVKGSEEENFKCLSSPSSFCRSFSI